MSLDIYLQPKATIPSSCEEREDVGDLRNDGYYWFLHPLFEKLRERTGQYIDLYGGAVFQGAGLDEVMQIIVEAKQLLDLKPERWEVHVGTQISPIREELYATVYKQEFEKLFDKLEKAIETAKIKGFCLMFVGD